MINTYKTAKILSVTSTAVDIIRTVLSPTIDVTENICAVLYVLIMGLTRGNKTTVFFKHLSPVTIVEEVRKMTVSRLANPGIYSFVYHKISHKASSLLVTICSGNPFW